MLNPGFSDEQNLKTLFAIDQDSIDQLEKNRDFLMQNQMVVQNILNIKVKKGYSCSSKEYHEFLCRFANYLSSLTINQEESTSQALALQRIQLVIETAYACRRPIVTNVGEIRISTCVKFDNVITSIRAKKLEAIKKVADEQVKLRKAKELKDIVQYQLMSRIRKGRTGVTTDQFIESLTAFLELPEEKIFPIRDLIQGQNIQIMGAGRSCQIGDDGSLLIPHDWR
jgi:nucleoside phosphorylase